MLKDTRQYFFILDKKLQYFMPSDTKDKILKTTFLLLLEKGYDKVLVSDIQNELGISRGLLYRYFKGKDELVYTACKEYFYNRYFDGVDYDKISLKDFLSMPQMQS